MKLRNIKHLDLLILITTLLFLLICSKAFPAIDTSRAVIHHTASHDVSAETIDQWHKERGWDGIGYNFVIRKDGTLENGRPLSKKGAHALGRNQFAGIVLTGYSEFTPLQIKTLKDLLKKFNTTLVERHHEECPSEGLDDELLEALKTMLVAVDFDSPLPVGHPGHEAYLNTVAIPRAKQAINKAEGQS